MERGAGEIRLADFDTVDLSNLNRLRCSIADLALNKAELCAREIWRIDPYLKIRVFKDGLQENNIEAFFTEGGKLDLLIEECDALDIKVLTRYKAKELGIPVLMETNDRCLIDIERFDLEPNRPLLHGLMGDLNPSLLKGLSQEEKISYLMPMVGLQALSERMKASMIEVQSSINSWPQLASAVTMGAGVAAELSRKILLNESTVSGRFYVDLDLLIPEPPKSFQITETESRPQLLDPAILKAFIKGFRVEPKVEVLSDEEKEGLLSACLHAPSGGNCQPWKFYFHRGHLFIFHEAHHSVSMLDYGNFGTYLSIGAVIENARIFAYSKGLILHYNYFPAAGYTTLVADLHFEKSSELLSYPLSLSELFNRHTNRLFTERKELALSDENNLLDLIGSNRIAQLTLIKNTDQMKELAEILTEAEKLLLLNARGHQDIFEREIRWTKEEAESKKDGIDLATLNMSKAEAIALKVAGSRHVMEWVSKIDGGEAFKRNTKKAIAASSAVGILTMPFQTAEAYLHGGEVMEKLWIKSNSLGLAFQPVTQFSYLLARANNNGESLNSTEKERLKLLHRQLQAIVPQTKSREIVFIFRIGYTEKEAVKSLRREISKMKIYD
jgi:nitroreductase